MSTLLRGFNIPTNVKRVNLQGDVKRDKYICIDNYSCIYNYIYRLMYLIIN